MERFFAGLGFGTLTGLMVGALANSTGWGVTIGLLVAFLIWFGGFLFIMFD
jgi:hypothetical protein